MPVIGAHELSGSHDITVFLQVDCAMLMGLILSGAEAQKLGHFLQHEVGMDAPTMEGQAEGQHS